MILTEQDIVCRKMHSCGRKPHIEFYSVVFGWRQSLSSQTSADIIACSILFKCISNMHVITFEYFVINVFAGQEKRATIWVL